MDREFYLAVLRLIIFLPLVLLLAYAAVRYGLGRDWHSTRGRGELEILERLPLGPKNGLVVVRVAGRFFLIGLGDGVPALLAELPDYPSPEMQTSEIQVYELPPAGEGVSLKQRFKLGKKRDSCS